MNIKYGIAPKKGPRTGNCYTLINIPHYHDDGDVKYIGNSEMNKKEPLSSRTQRLLANRLIPLSESMIIINNKIN